MELWVSSEAVGILSMSQSCHSFPGMSQKKVILLVGSRGHPGDAQPPADLCYLLAAANHPYVAICWKLSCKASAGHRAREFISRDSD